jgi:CDGSH iron-sulfur domain-containing protein 3
VVFDRVIRRGRSRSRPSTSEENEMARMVRHEKSGPYEVPEGTELPAWICGCGLSKNKPFCDGTHKKTKDEAPNEVYVYDDAGRVQVKNQY